MAGYFLKNDFTPSTSNTYTVSFWIKINDFTPTSINVPYCWSIGQQGQQTSGLFFQADTTPYCIGFYNGANGTRYMPTQMMRDTNAWYHVHLKVSSGTGTLYYNGESVKTSIVVPAQNSGGYGNTHAVHTYVNDPAGYDNLECVMSHFHFVDGTAYEPTVFGSTDATTGEWKINTGPSVTYGTNGYFILKDGNTGTDQSPNTNNFTLTGTCTKTEDCPSNVFCTLNPLHVADTNMSVTYSFGNTKYAGNSNHWQRAYGTIGANTGKFFYEFKVLNTSGTSDQLRVGWDSIDSINNGTDNYYSGLTIDTAGILRGGEDGYNNYDPNAVQMTAISGGNFSFTTGDILGMAIDIDNNTFSVYKNGTLEINAYSYASASNCSLLKSKGHFIAPSVNWYSTSGNANRSCFNFGNGYFETTAISSAGTNASNIGLFEYDVPANYTAFSTKGLNE